MVKRSESLELNQSKPLGTLSRYTRFTRTSFVCRSVQEKGHQTFPMLAQKPSSVSFSNCPMCDFTLTFPPSPSVCYWEPPNPSASLLPSFFSPLSLTLSCWPCYSNRSTPAFEPLAPSVYLKFAQNSIWITPLPSASYWKHWPVKGNFASIYPASFDLTWSRSGLYLPNHTSFHPSLGFLCNLLPFVPPSTNSSFHNITIHGYRAIHLSIFQNIW